MIQRLFVNILEVSMASSVAIIIVCAFLPLLENKYIAKVRYYILILIALRLLLPVPITIVDAPIQIETAQIVQAYENWEGPILSEIRIPEAMGSANVSSTDLHNSISLMEKSANFWFVGVLIFIFLKLIRHISFLKRLNRWSAIADSEQLVVFEKIISNMKIKRRISLRRCVAIESPMQLGLIYPVVLIPYKEYSETDLYLVLKHEIIHFKRRDIEVKVLLFLAQAIHWFNPFVYLLSKKLNETIEMCCDEHVISGNDSIHKKRYMETIFNSIDHRTDGANVFTTNYNGGLKVMKKRFRNIIESGSKRKGLLVVALLIAACLGLSSLVACSANTSSGTNQAQNKEVTEQNKLYNLPDTIKGLYAESKQNPELEKLIIDYLGIPTEYVAKTSYYYNYVDLNNDGSDEIFAVVMGPYTSGTGGSTALHIIQTGSSGMHVNQKFTLIQTPIIISDKITKGCKEIIVLNSGGGAASRYVVLTCSDGQYQTVNDGTAIESLEGIKGTAIICNNVLKDLESGKTLYLQKR